MSVTVASTCIDMHMKEMLQTDNYSSLILSNPPKKNTFKYFTHIFSCLNRINALCTTKKKGLTK